MYFARRDLFSGAAACREPAPASLLSARVNAETPPVWGGVPAAAGEPDDDLLSHGQSALSSAWSRFTVLFGMGRGGTDSLWSSGMTCCCRARGAVQPIWKK